MIHGVHHTAISTPDIERLLAFYRDLVGFEVESDHELEPHPRTDEILGLADARFRVVMLRMGESRLELFQFAQPTPEPAQSDRPVCNHGITHVCLRVSDIDDEAARLARGGMRFHCPPVQAGRLRATYGRDPDGNVVELLEG